MKRFFLALILMAGVLGVSAYSLTQVYTLKNTALPLLEQALEAAQQGNLAQAGELSQQVAALWEEQHQVLVFFLNHEPIDRISGLTARLPYLAAWEDASQFSAQTSELIDCIRSLWQDELPLPQNLL